MAADRPASKAIQSLASSATTAGVGLFIAANQEGGQIQELKGTGFSTIPSARGPGGAVRHRPQTGGRAWGNELRSAGSTWTSLPSLDVVPPGRPCQHAIGALQREFGHTPQVTAAHGVAFIAGMSPPAWPRPPSTSRAWAGWSATPISPPRLSTEHGPDPYLDSFQAAIKAGVPFVMIALATYTRIDPNHLAAFSSRIMRGLLRQQLHFGGVIVSDDLGAAAAVGLSPANRASTSSPPEAT